MASPVFVAPVIVDLGTRYLAARSAGFQQRWAAAERAADVKFTAESAGYAARLEVAQAQVDAAQREAAAARAQLARIDLAEPKGAAAAARDIARGNIALSVAKTTAKGAGPAPVIPEHVRIDPGEDAVQKYIAGLPSWSGVYGKLSTTNQKEMARAINSAEGNRDAKGVPTAPVFSRNSGVNKLVALAKFEAAGVPPDVSLVDLRDAAIREALAGSNNPAGVLALFSDGVEGLGLETASTVMEGVALAQDMAGNTGNNPTEVADYAKRSGGGAGGSASAKAKAAALETNAANADDLTPDYAAARKAAQDRLDAALLEIAATRGEAAPVDIGRIQRTRNEYAGAFGGARVTPTGAAPVAKSGGSLRRPIDDLLDEIEGSPTAAKMAGDDAIAAPLGPLAADIGPPVMRPAQPAISAPVKRPATQRTGVDRGVHYGPSGPPVPRANQPAIDALEGLDRFKIEKPAPAVSPDLAASDRALMEEHGLMGRDGKPRRDRAQRLADTTPAGREAMAAISAGGDLARLRLLTDPRARAIALGLRA
jgi:hypothetical protein